MGVALSEQRIWKELSRAIEPDDNLVPVGEEVEFANSVNSGEAAYRGQRGFFLVREDGAVPYSREFEASA